MPLCWRKSEGITKVMRIYPRGTMMFGADVMEDISVWIKAVDRPADWHVFPETMCGCKNCLLTLETYEPHQFSLFFFSFHFIPHSPYLFLSYMHHFLCHSFCINPSIHPYKRPIRWLERCLLRSSSIKDKTHSQSQLSGQEWRIVADLPGGINRGISSSTAGHATAEAHWPMKCAARQCPGPHHTVMNDLYFSVKHIKVRLHDG